MTLTDKQRLAYIDALRGAAALFVMLYHLALLPNPKLEVPGILSRYILNGGTGVTLFFVISAFTMCLTMEGKVSRQDDIYNFYLRRFFRIAPLFYVILGVSIFRDGYLHGVWHDFKTIVLNIVFLFNFFPGKSGGIAWASWTIGVEMLFYVLFPFLFRYVDNLVKAIGLFWALLIVSELFHAALAVHPLSKDLEASFLPMSLLNQLPNFAMGMVTFFTLKQMNARKLHQSWYWTALLAGCYLFHALISGRLNLLFAPLYWQAIIYSLILIGASVIQSRILIKAGAVFLGKISYSFYLIHPLMIALLYPVYPKIYSVGNSCFVHFLLSALVTILPLTLVSWISYRFIEKPFIRMIAKRQKTRVTIRPETVAIN